MTKRKHLSKTQRTAAWRIARYYLGHAMNANDPFRGTDGLTDQLRTLHVGRRLGQRIFARGGRPDGRYWTERGIPLIEKDWPHAGKIASHLVNGTGWKIEAYPVATDSVVDHHRVVAAIRRPDLPRMDIPVRDGFPSDGHALRWALKPEGQDKLRHAFLILKP